jgi:hypothetical protein
LAKHYNQGKTVLITPAVDLNKSMPIDLYFDRGKKYKIDNPRFNNNSDIFDEIKPVLADKEKTIIVILFACRMLHTGWSTIELMLNKNANNLLVRLRIYDPVGTASLTKENQSKLHEILFNRLSLFNNNFKIEFDDQEDPYLIRRKADCSHSSGVLVVEDIINRANGYRLYLYEKEVNAIRDEHLKLVKSLPNDPKKYPERTRFIERSEDFFNLYNTQAIESSSSDSSSDDESEEEVVSSKKIKKSSNEILKYELNEIDFQKVVEDYYKRLHVRPAGDDKNKKVVFTPDKSGGKKGNGDQKGKANDIFNGKKQNRWLFFKAEILPPSILTANVKAAFLGSVSNRSGH